MNRVYPSSDKTEEGFRRYKHHPMELQSSVPQMRFDAYLRDSCPLEHALESAAQALKVLPPMLDLKILKMKLLRPLF